MWLLLASFWTLDPRSLLFRILLFWAVRVTQQGILPRIEKLIKQTRTTTYELWYNPSIPQFFSFFHLPNTLWHWGPKGARTEMGSPNPISPRWYFYHHNWDSLAQNLLPVFHILARVLLSMMSSLLVCLRSALTSVSLFVSFFVSLEILFSFF